VIATVYFTIAHPGTAESMPKAFLVTSGLVALDLAMLAILLRRLPERLFER